MKILFDDQIFSMQRFGGVSRYITEVAERVANHAQVKVSAGLYLNRYLKGNSRLDYVGCVVDTEKAWRVRDPLNQICTAAVSRSFAPDVVHETYYRVRNLHSQQAKIVVTVHDMIHEMYPSEAAQAEFHAHLKHMALERADAIICVSETTRSDLLTIYPHLRSHFIEVIPHGHGFRPPSEGAAERIRSATAGSPFILFVGRRGGYKRFEDLVAAYAILASQAKDLKVLCFGANPFNAEELEALGIHRQRFVHVSGSDDLLNAAYSQALAFCYPSLYEGFGIPILEALAADCPVVCSDTAIFKEVGQDNVRFHPPKDAEGLACELLQAIASKKSPHAIPPKFSWDQSARDHLRVYQAIS